MKKFNGLKTQNRKYVRGKTRFEYCQGDCDTDCKECVFGAPLSQIGTYSDGERFEEWVASNEASINWEPKDYFISLFICETEFKFRTEKLRQSAIREIIKLIKTLPKG